MTLQDQPLHFIFVPLMAQGHMIPMIDMARLFARRGVVVTIVTTPFNSYRFKTIIDRETESSIPIQILELRFPYQEAGLPEGSENLDTLPSRDLAMNFFAATRMLQKPLEQSLGELEPKPSCIISDFTHPWTSEIACKFQIPRIIFHGISCFSLLCSHNILLHKVHERVTWGESLIVPDIPDWIEIKRSQLPTTITQCSPDTQELHNQIKQAEASAFGVLVNSFDCLEARYIEEYQKVWQNKVWCVGPVSLCNKDDLDKTQRGNTPSIDEHQVLKWLNLREVSSVIYVCLGSLCRLLPSQLIEIGLGLEASKNQFVWVVRGGNKSSELDKWLDEGFEERNKNKGLIIRGWAPQILILSHPAIGGFLTHCGWNSTMEGVCAGVPMITWPMFAEQFFNEKFIVQVLGMGVRVGVDDAVQWGEEEKVGVLVKKEKVEKAVNELMYHSEEGEERKRKAKELGEMARRAMEEGGSSHMNITLFIQDIIMHLAGKKQPDAERNTIWSSHNLNRIPHPYDKSMVASSSF